jgi:hypothetical protein
MLLTLPSSSALFVAPNASVASHKADNLVVSHIVFKARSVDVVSEKSNGKKSIKRESMRQDRVCGLEETRCAGERDRSSALNHVRKVSCGRTA